MRELIQKYYAPRVCLYVRDIGTATQWERPRHPHTATSWCTISTWDQFAVGDLVEIADGIILIVREVKHVWNKSIQREIVLDFAIPFPLAGYQMKKLGFDFYEHGGSAESLLTTRQDAFA